MPDIQHENANVRNRPLALMAAVFVLIAGGLGYRATIQLFARSPDSTPLPAGALAALPMEIGSWRGVDVPMDEAIIRATDTDQILNRAYAHAGDRRTVSLYIAYGVRLRDLMPHRPEVCYPGNGWTLEKSTDIRLTPAESPPLSCRIFRFDRSGLDARRITVLSYYIVDGRYSRDVELLRSRIWRPSSGAEYVAQVQITCTAGPGRPTAEQSVQAFAARSASAIRSLLPTSASLGDSTGADSSR
ncbi:MAG: exosortase C-terminal domain/associated protein EpsI [Phycisphaerae bacterium]